MDGLYNEVYNWSDGFSNMAEEEEEEDGGVGRVAGGGLLVGNSSQLSDTGYGLSMDVAGLGRGCQR